MFFPPCVVVMYGLGMLGLCIIYFSVLEMYRVIKYRTFGFNEDTILCGVLFIFGIMSILMSLSVGGTI